MIKLLLFDVGETLIHEGQASPHVAAALAILTEFETESGDPLSMGIVSDFLMPEQPVTEAKIAAIEGEFLRILKTAGLDAFFQPPERHVTLSTRAGVRKPARAIFELAATRSGTNASLAECAFVTENEAHLAAAKSFGLKSIKFGEESSSHRSFSDWVDGPLVIANEVAPTSMRDSVSALAFALEHRHNVAGFTCLSRAGHTYRGQAGYLVQLDRPELGDLRGVYVDVPTDVAVECTSDGKINRVERTPPSAEEIADAASYLESLRHHGKVVTPERPVQRGATHEIQQDEQGRRILVRRRFSNVGPVACQSRVPTGEPDAN